MSLSLIKNPIEPKVVSQEVGNPGDWCIKMMKKVSEDDSLREIELVSAVDGQKYGNLFPFTYSTELT